MNSGRSSGRSGPARDIGHGLEALILDPLREFGIRQLGGGLRLPSEPECSRRGRAAISRSRIVSRTKSCTNDAVAEAHLGLRRMHVHVHLFAIAIQEQQRERIAGRRHQVVIGRRKRVQQQAVADQPAVDEQVDRIAVELLHLRAGNEAAQREDARGSRSSASTTSSSRSTMSRSISSSSIWLPNT